MPRQVRKPARPRANVVTLPEVIEATSAPNRAARRAKRSTEEWQAIINEQASQIVQMQQTIAQQNSVIERLTTRFGAAQFNLENAQAQLQELQQRT